MGLQVIGAGLPRTGTSSLRDMLEQLLGGPCYHMRVLYEHREEHGPKWMAALGGDAEALDDVLDGYDAAVDWPSSVFWRELAERHPEALVVLSHRGSSERWWRSADATVWEVMRRVEAGEQDEHVPGSHRLMRQLAGFDDAMAEAAARARYDSHLEEVRAAIPAERLLLWDPTEGWEPICDRLDLPVPDDAPAHANTSAEFRGRLFSEES